MITYIILIAALIVILVSFSADNFIYMWKLRQIANTLPTLSGTLPFVGHGIELFLYRKDVFAYIKNKTNEIQKLGGTVVIWLGPLPIFVVTDPNDAIIVANECLEKSYFYKFAKSWLGDGLLTGSKPIWKVHRKLVTPSFNQNILVEFMPIFNENSKQITDILYDKVGKGYFDPTDMLAKNNLDILSKTVLGVKPGVISVPEYRRMAEYIIRIIVIRVTNILLHLDMLYKLTPLCRKEMAMATQLKGVSRSVLNEKRKKQHLELIHSKNNISYDTKDTFKPFLDMLLEVNDNGLLSEEEVLEELDTMVLVGYNTTTFAQLYILPMLAKHQDVQDKVYEEISRVIPKNAQNIEMSDLNKLVYLNAVVKEVMRIYPLVPVVVRNVDQPVRLSDITIPGGSVMINIYGINRNKCWGEDAEAFKPERWLNPDTLPKYSYAFASFSIGKRNCIGRPFAMLSIKTFLAHVIRKYRIYKKPEDFKIEFTLFAKPVSGHRISLELRS